MTHERTEDSESLNTNNDEWNVRWKLTSKARKNVLAHQKKFESKNRVTITHSELVSRILEKTKI